jgi:DeoR/GlpR family transcriptional regulator of sugar metabolism
MTGSGDPAEGGAVKGEAVKGGAVKNGAVTDAAVEGGAGAADQRARQDHIRHHVAAHGSVRIQDLAETFGVSSMTIHRDLDVLQSQGWLRKVRGGATAEPSALFHGDFGHRSHAMLPAKQAIAAAAVELIRPGQAVVVDDSTTALSLAELLPGRLPITVVTNFLAAIKLLAGQPGVDLVGLGGAYYPAYDAFLGMRTLEAIQPIRADVLFMSTTAVTDGICYHTSTDTIQVKRALMAAAAQRVLLVDHSKFARRALNELCPLTAFDVVFVDSGLDPRIVADLSAQGVNIRVVEATRG